MPLTLVAVVPTGLLWEASTQLVAPPRRPLMDYHQDWLTNQANHGIQVTVTHCLDGKVPCLLVSPDPAAGPAQRGQLLRSQLVNQGYSLPPYGQVQGTLVLLHGRRGRKEDLLPVAERFCAAGFRCLLPDLPAHGESPIESLHFGRSELESALPSEVLVEMSRQHGFPAQPASLWGMSMGGCFAVRNASLHSGVWDSLVIVSSFDDLETLVEEESINRLGPLGPAFASLTQRLAVIRGGIRTGEITPAHWATQISAPVLVAHGDVDRLISKERGRRLFDGFGSREKRWVEVNGGDHNNVLITPMPLYSTMAAWFLDY